MIINGTTYLLGFTINLLKLLTSFFAFSYTKNALTPTLSLPMAHVARVMLKYLTSQ